MTTDDDNNKTFGINWKYLSTLLESYEDLLTSQKQLIQSIAGCSGISPKQAYAILCSDVYTFFVSVESQYVNYLKDKDISIQDYYNILSTIIISKKQQDYKKLLELSRLLCYWATKEGPFKTLTEHNDPNQSW